MRPDPGLDELLTALRGARFTVGVTETLRLRRLFEVSAQADLKRLGLIVAAVVVKSREEEERFQEIFAAWKEGAEAAFREPEKAAIERPGPGVAVPVRRPWRRALLVAGAAVVAASVVIGVWRWRRPPGPPLVLGDGAPVASGAAAPGDSAVPATSAAPVASADPAAAEKPPETFTTPYPVLTIEAGGQSRKRAMAAETALFTAVLLWLGLSHRFRLREPEPPVAPRRGPPDFVLGAPPLRGPVLLEEAEREALVWSVGQFTTDQLTNVLDVERSVEATAAGGGVPAPRFRAERRHRSVWLWIDESADDPAILRFADEMTAALAGAGLPVERATYWAVPDRVTASDGTVLGPADLEEHGESAITAVLTDGRALGARFAASAKRGPLDALLRTMARWPTVAFVDFSRGQTALPALVAGQRVPVLDPEAAVAFLAGTALPRGDGAGEALHGDARAWAAACALSPRAVSEEQAYALRKALDLKASGWTLGLLQRRGSGAPGTVDFALAERVALLGWLRRAERGRPGTLVDPESLLGKAIAFWRAAYEDERKRRERDDPAVPWKGTPGERTLRFEAALVDLWDRPAEAAGVLHGLRGTELDGAVRRACEVLAPLECEGTKAAVVLPWRRGEQPDEVRVMLADLGFGKAAGLGSKETLVLPGRMWVALALAGGLGVGAMAAVLRPRDPVCEVPAGVPGAWCDLVPREGAFTAVAGVGGFWETQPVSRGDLVSITFPLKEKPCSELRPDGIRVVRCGLSGPMGRRPPGDTGRRRIVVISGATDVTLLLLGFGRHEEKQRAFQHLAGVGAFDVVFAGKANALDEHMRDLLPVTLHDEQDKILLIENPRGELSAWRLAMTQGSVAAETFSSTFDDVEAMFGTQGTMARFDAMWVKTGECLTADERQRFFKEAPDDAARATAACLEYDSTSGPGPVSIPSAEPAPVRKDDKTNPVRKDDKAALEIAPVRKDDKAAPEVTGAATPGSLVVNSPLWPAHVVLDEKQLGIAPITVTAAPGSHHVRCYHAGGARAFVVEIKSGITSTVSCGTMPDFSLGGEDPDAR